MQLNFENKLKISCYIKAKDIILIIKHILAK